VTLLLNEFIAGPAIEDLNAYSFQADVITIPKTTITIPMSGLKVGDYLVRIMVDGAESPLATDGDGKYNAPQISIP
jgi:uncharacterized protein (DUF2141 family)